MDLFARQGYARATTAELAKAAGVTEPIIYRHFSSKRDLFIALIERTARDTLRHWEQVLSSATDPAQRMKRLIGDNPMVRDDGRAPYRVFLQAITEVNDPDIRQAVSDHISNLHAFLAREVKRAQDDRKLTKVFSAELVAWRSSTWAWAMACWRDGRAAPGRGREGHHVQNMLERLLVGRSSE
jgi:AcrR family transcriptional regulator